MDQYVVHNTVLEFTHDRRTWWLTCRQCQVSDRGMDLLTSGPGPKDLFRRWQVWKDEENKTIGTIAGAGLRSPVRVFIYNLGKRADGEYQISFVKEEP